MGFSETRTPFDAKPANGLRVSARRDMRSDNTPTDALFNAKRVLEKPAYIFEYKRYSVAGSFARGPLLAM